MESMSISNLNKKTEYGKTLASIAKVFSDVLEEEINPKQSLYILNAILAAIVTVFAIGMPLWFTGLSLLWLWLGLHLCKKAGLGEERE